MCDCDASIPTAVSLLVFSSVSGKALDCYRFCWGEGGASVKVTNIRASLAVGHCPLMDVAGGCGTPDSRRYGF
jgi:hypothetical protein